MGDLILVDTSAWIEFLRRAESPVADMVDRILAEDLAALTGVVKAELLQGARSDREFEDLRVLLSACHSCPEPPDLWDRVARLGRSLRRNGVSGVGIPDMIVGVTAVHNDVSSSPSTVTSRISRPCCRSISSGRGRRARRIGPRTSRRA